MIAKPNKGFSLIELIIAMAIIAILTSFAWPSYVNYIVRSSRQAVRAELLQLANVQEKVYLNANAYTLDITGAYTGTAAGGLGDGDGSSGDGKYGFTIVGNAQAYVITATPGGGTTQDGDGFLRISSDGTRTHHLPNGTVNPW